ncbi:MAG TPA: HNH endonuclease [Shinella sp.]|jgi:hypothetical protein|uniref:HNH endonuclease n=1 Tax=Shinella sp. TaxID=1870904 RepID=UPI002E118D1D|nr:HNH endonuclease [Shinella sp.]
MEKCDFYAQFSSEEEEFYALTLLGEGDRIVWATQSHWVGFTNDIPPREIREASLAFARVAKVWHDISQPFCVVRSERQMLNFMLSGGNALIEPALFEDAFRDFLKPMISIPDGYVGFAGTSLFDISAFKRMPTPKLRMKILKRDGRKCRICGRNPDNHLDLELHVHHIRPWSKGGITDEKNLITLCNTCHNGLDPHYDPGLFAYTVPENLKPDIKARAKKHAEGVRQFRRIMVTAELEREL